MTDNNPALMNIEAEMSIIGSIFVYEHAAWERIGDDLRPEHFGSTALSEVFGACLDLVAEGKKPNPITLNGRFDRSLIDHIFEAATTPINAGEYARIAIDLWAKRVLIQSAEAAIKSAAEPVADIAAALEAALETAAEKNSAAVMDHARQIDDALIEIEKAYKGEIDNGLSTGLVSVDRIIGGMKPGQLILIGGRTSMGKTSLAVAIADQGEPTALFELEMTASEIHKRRLSLRTGVPFWAIDRGKMHEDQADRVFAEGAALKKARLYINDAPGMTVAAIKRHARRLKRKYGIRLLVIDHLQLLKHPKPRGNATVELGEIVKEAKEAAKELGLPVVLLSQLSRAVDSRDDHRPTLADLRQSGEIEEAADIVMFVYREEYYLANERPTMREGESADGFADRAASHESRAAKVSGTAEIIVAKNRNGQCTTANVKFSAQTMRFYEDGSAPADNQEGMGL